MMRLPSALAQHLTALRTLLVLTVLTGVVYPIAVTAIAQLPGLKHNADGSLLTVGKVTVGSTIIGQSFVDKDGKALVQYFQSRPSAAGDGYDPTATSASNLGPESIVDTLGNPAQAGDPNGDGGQLSLLSQVCSRSVAIGKLEGVDGARPYCTPGGLGAVLAVFHKAGGTGEVTRVVSLNEVCPATPFLARYKGVKVECSKFGKDYSKGVVTPIRGAAPADSAVPPDAVTASGSGLDFQISPAYADLQATRVAKARGIDVAAVRKLVSQYTTGRALGFLGEPGVNVLRLNIALDEQDPYQGN
jgi:potassium-transporting ATPase KdpC subunit